MYEADGRPHRKGKEREGFPSASRRRRALLLVYVCIPLQHYTRRSCVEIKGVLACVREPVGGYGGGRQGGVTNSAPHNLETRRMEKELKRGAFYFLT